MATVGLRDVRKSYGGMAVLHGISTEIADGEFVVIVGPSGCGKSTLLRTIAGLETITAGEIWIGDRKVNQLEPKDRDIAMVFQNYALYPHMSVFDNMAYGLRIRGLSKPDIATRVARAAAILQLEPFLQRKPRQLSGGQRQRVAMGRAIVREPAAFLFDEPLSNLDAKLRVQMRVEIKRLQQQLGVTSIYVTHDQVEAMTLADRLIVMNAGHAEQIGAPLALYATPATTYVAGFIGSPAMNFLPARLAADGAAVELDVQGGGGARLALGAAARPLDGAGEGHPVTLGVRPEHLAVVPSGGLPLRVELVEALGADTLVYGRLASDASLVARLPGTTAVKLGDIVPVAPAPDSLHLFDAETGKRLG
jgi:sn-glycerol 3-phosphate transport system ATP-binding protein